jgi:hypothetical protein
MVSSAVVFATNAHASLMQLSAGLEGDTSAWRVETYGSGGGYVDTNAANARTGTKSGFVYSTTSWSGIGRNIVVPSYNVRNYTNCAAGIYSKGLASYFEVIDTATWTYLRPLAHNTGSTSYKQLISGSWAARPQVYFRYVAAASAVGSFTYAYVDDAVLQCLY